MKVTTEDDLLPRRAAAGGRSETRTASGFDVHRFCAGDHVMLCGIAVPHDQGLLGHSDADVGLHALTDALLGTHRRGRHRQPLPAAASRAGAARRPTSSCATPRGWSPPPAAGSSMSTSR